LTAADFAPYLQELARLLRPRMLRRRRLLAECASHLVLLAEAEERAGAAPAHAISCALARFGTPQQIAAAYAREVPIAWGRVALLPAVIAATLWLPLAFPAPTAMSLCGAAELLPGRFRDRLAAPPPALPARVGRAPRSHKGSRVGGPGAPTPAAVAESPQTAIALAAPDTLLPPTPSPPAIAALVPAGPPTKPNIVRAAARGPTVFSEAPLRYTYTNRELWLGRAL
jgi:hypothetical protein